MMKLTLRRCVTFLLLVLVTLGFLSQKYGFFNNFIHKFEDMQLEAQINHKSDSGTTVSDVPSSSGKGVKSHSGTADTITGATGNADEGVLPPQKSIEPEHISTYSSQSFVSIVQSPKQNAFDLDYDDIRFMVREAVDLAGGLEKIIRDGQTVVLKPNLVQKHSDVTGKLFSKESNGITTDWRVTKAVAEIVRELNPNGKIYVMEGSAGDKTPDTMEYMNYTPQYMPEVDEFIAIENDSGGWQEYDSPRLVKVSLPNGLLHKEYYLNKRYLEADVLISIPTLKNNSGTIVTGGIKNVAIGATPANIYGPSKGNLSRTKMVSHSFSRLDLQLWLYDYYMCRPINFVVMDGLQGFQNGPAPSRKDSELKDIMNMRLVMAGKDAVAVDTIECLTTGWDPQSAAYLRYLEKSGMGNLDTAKITVLGSRVDQVRKDFQARFENPGWVRVSTKIAPEFTIEKAEFSGNRLNLSIKSEASKIEVYIDNALKPFVFTSGFEDMTIGTENLAKGKHTIKIYVYDRFLNCGDTSFELDK